MPRGVHVERPTVRAGEVELRALIDEDELVGLVRKHYEALGGRHKGMLPLKRVSVPETIDEGAHE